MSSSRASAAGTDEPVPGERQLPILPRVAGEWKPPVLPRPYRSAPTSPEKGAAAAVGGWMSSLSIHPPDVAPPGPAGELDEDDDLIVAEMTGVGAPAPMDGFEDDEVGLAAVALRNVGFEVPTLLQSFSIPVVMAGRDLLVVTAPSAKAAGKSAAFCLPVVSGLLRDGDGVRTGAGMPRAVILAPTSERAAEIYNEAKKCSYNTNLRIEMVTSGTAVFSQLRDLLRGVDILVATPGRLVDILERSTISLDSTLYFIVDEIDRIVDMGLESMIREIAKLGMPEKRHSTVFSATLLTAEIQMLASVILSDPILINIGRVLPNAETILQKIVFVQDLDNKKNHLLHLLWEQPIGLAMEQPLMLIFVETTLEANSLSCWLSNEGFAATVFHGDSTQEEKESALQSFKSGLSPILVASDAASWGLNVQNIPHVINYDLPKRIEGYVHRIRKTEKRGLATSFFTESNQSLAKGLAKLMTRMKQDVPDFLVEYAQKLQPREAVPPYFDYLVDKFMTAIAADVKAKSSFEDIDYKAVHQCQTNEYANSALLDHNSKGDNKDKYELVQAITSCGISDSKGWYVHVNFTAMNSENSKVDFFFAELSWDSDKKAWVPTCVVKLEENERVGGFSGTNGSDYRDGMNIRVDLQHCYACGADLKHPMEGELYETGHKAMSECYGRDP